MDATTAPSSRHECEPPAPSGTTLPPPWRCPDCGALWIAQGPTSANPEGDREVAEHVTWTWARFEDLTPA
jgi:hypothetical protein